MSDVPVDMQERLELCKLLDELGPSAPTLLDGWSAGDLAAHIVVRERDLVAGLCLVLPGPFQGSQSRAGPNWLRAKTSSGSSRIFGAVRPADSFGSAGSAASRIGMNSSFIT